MRSLNIGDTFDLGDGRTYRVAQIEVQEDGTMRASCEFVQSTYFTAADLAESGLALSQAIKD